MKNNRIAELIAEIEDELHRIDMLSAAICETWKTMPKSTKKRRIHEESLALKLHNFYTGCERIFCKVADELNGGMPQSKDWHKRILRQMTLDVEGIRPSLISKKTESELVEYLGFRHVVRNIYGSEIRSDRIGYLVAQFPSVLKLFNKDIRKFITFLKALLQ